MVGWGGGWKGWSERELVWGGMSLRSSFSKGHECSSINYRFFAFVLAPPPNQPVISDKFRYPIRCLSPTVDSDPPIQSVVTVRHSEYGSIRITEFPPPY